jgi:hypothetical protein
MGAEAVPFSGSLEYALSPGLFHTSVSLNVRDSPDPEAELIRTLPRGAVVVGLSGRMDGHESLLGQSGSWLYVVPSQHHLGWSASRFLEPDAGCLPAIEDVVAAVAPDVPAAFYEDTLVSRARFREGDLGFDGFMSVSRDPDRSRSIVAVHRHDGRCALSPLVVVPVSGWVVDVLMTETDATGGESLIFIAWQSGKEPHREGLETWTGHRLADDRPIFEASVPSSQHLPRARRASFAVRLQSDASGAPGYFPMRIRHADGRREFYEWDGERLSRVDDDVPAAPEAATPMEEGG